MSITTSLSTPLNLLQSIYSGGPIEIVDDILISFNKNILYMSTLPDLHEVKQLVISETHEDFITTLTINDDNLTTYVFTKSARCYIVDIDNQVIINSFQTPHTQLINNTIYNQYMEMLITVSLDHTLKVFNQNNSMIKSYKLEDLVLELKIANDKIVVIIMKNQTLLLDLESLQMMQLESTIPTTCTYLSDQKLLLFASKDKTISLYKCEQIDKIQKTTSTYIIDTLYSMQQIDNRYITCISGKGNLVVIDITHIGQKNSENDDLTYKYYYSGIHPQDHFAFSKAYEIRIKEQIKPFIYDFIAQMEQPTNQFINLRILQTVDENGQLDHNKIVLTDVQNTIFIFSLTDPIFIEQEVHLPLINAVHGEYGEILSIQLYEAKSDDILHYQQQHILTENNEEQSTNNQLLYILFSSSSNLLNVYNVKRKSVELLFGHDNPIQHVKICGNLLFTASQNLILIHQLDEVTYNAQNGLGRLFIKLILKINLHGQHYVSAFDAYVGPSRQMLVYAKETKIHMIELTKLLRLANKSLNEGILSSITAEDVEQFVTAHLQVINSLRINFPYQQIISASADKSVAVWSFDKQLSKQQNEQKLTLFDIFTNKVSSKFTFGVEKTNYYLYLVKQLHNDFKRTIWSVDINSSGKFFLISSGDKKVRLYKISNNNNKSDVYCLKTFSCFLAPVVQAAFLNQHQIITLEQSAVLRLININTSEIQQIVDIGIIMKRDTTSQWMRKKLNSLQTGQINNQTEQIDDTFIEFSTSAMQILNSNQIFVGSSGGELYEVHDNSDEVELQKKQETQIKMQNQLTFQQYIDSQQYQDALLLALKLNDEGQALKLFENLITKNEGINLNINGFTLEQVEWCLKQSLNWLKFNKKYQFGLTLLVIVLKYAGVKVLLDAGYKQVLDEIRNLLQKHQERLQVARGEALFLDWM